MTYGGVQMFMEKLRQLMTNCQDIPFINNPKIIKKRPQFQLLYQELGSMIQTLSMDQHIQDLEKLNHLKQRFISAAQEAEYIVDLFLSGVNIRSYRRSFKYVMGSFLSWIQVRNNVLLIYEDFNPSLNLDDVRRSLKAVEVEFMSMRTDGSMKMDGSSPRHENQSSIPSSSSGSKKLMDQHIVGLDLDVGHLRDKLVEDRRKLDVVSIVGMGGTGKTTLATKVFNDGYVKHHFHVRVWVTVSQTYDKRGVLTQILQSIRGQLNILENATDSRLRELVHKQLMGRRYLVVIDDIWDIETWDDLKLFFPNNNNGSRILLTSRLTEVAKHANSDGLVHHLGGLSKERSWELLCQKVFHGNKCPEWSIKPGMRIVEKCQGLPLALVVIAGVLAKEAWSEKFWVEIAKSTGSYLVGDENGCLDTLALSYNHLPFHLRECFLYLGGFPEDYVFDAQRLIYLWVAEGFIQEDGNRSLEDVAEGNLMDLIDRNLVTVTRTSKSNGGVKSCIVHDLVRELCLIKAKEEGFILETKRLILSSEFSNVTTPPPKPIRMFVNKKTKIRRFPYPSVQNFRSIFFLRWPSSGSIANCFRSFVLLRVVDLRHLPKLNDFPKGMELLVHLRYLAISMSDKAGFPSSVCNLWGLQTLIFITAKRNIYLPSNISDLVNLRHLWCARWVPLILTSIEKPMNLVTIRGVELREGIDNFQKCFPCIKKLKCMGYSLKRQYDFQSLTRLEELNFSGNFFDRMRSIETNYSLMQSSGKNYITFPATLKSLTLVDCNVPWGDMSIIQSLPNLQVLKLKLNAFKGSCWNTDGQEFPQLKFLRLEYVIIKRWEAHITSFPCLQKLEIISCRNLEEIPLEIGDIPTLELIKIEECRHSVEESVRRIQEEQRESGNYNLKIHISRKMFMKRSLSA